MAKKSKSKKSNSVAAAGAKLPTTNQVFPHDAFDAALRRYAHPAAVVDLDLLVHGGPAWRRFLEAFGQTMFDLSLAVLQSQLSSPFVKLQLHSGVSALHSDMSCLLVSAIALWKGQQGLSALKIPSVYHTMVYSVLPSFGRPLPTKSIYLLEHRAELLKMEEFYMAKEKNPFVLRSSSTSVRKEISLSTSRIDLTTLAPIPIRDLVLYNSHEGKYIEGKLIVEPFTPQVGTNTLLEDSNGDVVLVIVYNMLPDGLYGRESVPLASSKLPMGASVRIVEPFFKIFQDGRRGIRVDNPNDIVAASLDKKCGDTSSVDEDRMLIRAKESGNSLVQMKKYNAASEAYISGIRQASVVPTLLSNRSQAYAMMNDWARSLADAAASLTMRPDNAKAWHRYNKAFEIISKQSNNDRRNIMTSLMHIERDEQAIVSDAVGKDCSALKDAGNAAFGKKDYGRAAEFYTSALAMHGETSRALLSNWALCCIRNSANLDALAASFASLRIRHEAKAVTRLATSLLYLGEAVLCQTVLTGIMSEVISGSDEESERRALLDSVCFCEEGTVGYLRPMMSQTLMSLKHFPTYVGPIEPFHAGAKGRGIRATEDIQTGQVLIVEHPLAMCEVKSDKECLVIMDSATNRVKDHSQDYLRQEIILRSKRECVLSHIVDSLSDGFNQRGVTSFQDMMPNLTSCKLLLPSHYDFLEEKHKIELSPDRVDAIVGLNSFGDMDTKNGKNITCLVSTRLVPATSMFNHSKHPTCAITSKGRLSIGYALDNVKAGEELTIRYHADDETIRSKWGIHE